MTYNFDPEAWFERELAALNAKRERGEIDDNAHAVDLDELNRRYDDMVARLDGTFEIPATAPDRSPSG
jgi:hypothetical protein